jgi:predicted ATP-grasp superfamily ATP-dependent carboligase
MGSQQPEIRMPAQLEHWLGGLARRSSAPSRLPSPAIILGGSCNGLSFARSLGRRGIRCVMLDSERLLGTFTRFATVALLPSAAEQPQYWIELLEQIGSRLPQRGVLFATSDLHSLLFARHSDRLRRYYRFIVPDLSVLETIVNKRRQYDVARQVGVPIPAVHFPDSLQDAQRISRDLIYPCILKPYESHSSRNKLDKRKVVIVRSAQELIDAHERTSRASVPMMIQEIIPGGDDALYGYLGFWDEGARERAWLTKRKLRQYPPGFGDGSLQETIDAPEVAELSRRLLRALNYSGFVGVEFKLDPRDGTFRLMEINPRTVSGNQLAISGGVDFPWIGYRHLTGDCDGIARSGRAPAFRRGVRYLNEEWDVQAFLAMRKSGQLTLRQWLKSLTKVDCTAIGAWDDPGPLLAGVRRVLRFDRNGAP